MPFLYVAFGALLVLFIAPIIDGLTQVILSIFELWKGKVSLKIATINKQIQDLGQEKEAESSFQIGFQPPIEETFEEDDEFYDE